MKPLTVEEQLLLLKSIDYTPLNYSCGLCFCIRLAANKVGLRNKMNTHISETIPLFIFENSEPFHDEKEFAQLRNKFNIKETAYREHYIDIKAVYSHNYWWVSHSKKSAEQRKAFIQWIIKQLEDELNTK